MVADACGKFGITLAELSVDTVEKIKPALLPFTKISNPLDIFAVGIPLNAHDAYQAALIAFIEDPNVDVILCCLMVNRSFLQVDVNHLVTPSGVLLRMTGFI